MNNETVGIETNIVNQPVVESSNTGIKDWRELYFNKSLCEGVVLNEGNGNVRVVGRVKIPNPNVKIMYWAANPADFNTSFSGSGLPFANPEQAFDNTENIGAVNTMGGNFEFTLNYPNSYYVGLGSLYIGPNIHIKICEPGYENEYYTIKLGEGIPFRTLTHPAPPTNNFRVGPTFYNNDRLTIRSQEQILRDSAYPRFNIIPPAMPDNFWGLRPPR